MVCSTCGQVMKAMQPKPRIYWCENCGTIATEIFRFDTVFQVPIVSANRYGINRSIKEDV